MTGPEIVLPFPDFRPMQIQALLFDFDGSILDTETPDLVAWNEIFAEYGAVLEHEYWCQFVGKHGGMLEVVAYLEQQTGQTLESDALLARRRARCLEMIYELGPRPGVVQWLDEARGRGIGCAIASSSSLVWVEEHLERLDLRDYFAGVRCRDHVERTKPDPDVYLAALDLLAARPDEAIAIEDSPHGVAAAKAAGVFCIAVPNEVTRPLDFSSADMVLDSLEQMSLGELVTHLDGSP